MLKKITIKVMVGLLVLSLLALPLVVGACEEELPEEFTLKITAVGEGTTSPAPGTYTKTEGESVTVTATPATGYELDRWEGDVSGTDDSITLKMTADKSVVAVFVEEEWEWPETLQITSSTGVGQEQWVSFTSIMTNQTGMNILVVPEGVPALRFKSVQQGEFFATAGGSADFENIIEALTTYASEDGGPSQIRIVWTYGVVTSGFITRADSEIETIYDIEAGVRMPDYPRIPTIRTKMMEALLAWVQVSPDDVEWVEFGSYDSMLQGIADGKIDVSFAFLHSPVLVEVAAAPHGLALLELPYDEDTEGAQRFMDVYTTASFGIVERTAVSDIKGMKSMAGVTAMITDVNSDEELVYQFAKWMADNYLLYKDAHAQNEYMSLEGMKTVISTSFIPVHEGTIRYLKEKGLWTEANDARQAENIALIQRYVDAYAAAIAAAEAQGIEVAPENDAWLDFWTQYKEDQGLPEVANFAGLD
jgi:TRAP transporter TAXI family solute receptor